MNDDDFYSSAQHSRNSPTIYSFDVILVLTDWVADHFINTKVGEQGQYRFQVRTGVLGDTVWVKPQDCRGL